MRPVLLLCSLLLAQFLSSCSAQSRPQAIPAQSLAVSPGQVLLVKVDTGVVNLQRSEDQEIHIHGRLMDPGRTDYQVSSSPEEIRVQALYHKPLLRAASNPALELDLRVPVGTALRLENFDATVSLRGLNGVVQVDSIAGDILAEGINGEASLRSGRGDVRVTGSMGKLYVLGEHGVLAVEYASGEVGMSTIMGTIRFTGQPEPGDQIRLETDHGPVEILLGAQADLSVSIQSTSGELSCMFPGIKQILRSCSGILGDGSGSLSVRTVSGDVLVQQIH